MSSELMILWASLVSHCQRESACNNEASKFTFLYLNFDLFTCTGHIARDGIYLAPCDSLIHFLVICYCFYMQDNTIYISRTSLICSF